MSCRHVGSLNEFNRAFINQKIDICYDCTIGGQSIILIRQSDFAGTGRREDSCNDLTCDVLFSGTHPYHRDDVYFECNVPHGAPCSTALRGRLLARANRQ
jgi:hypothetical protein